MHLFIYFTEICLYKNLFIRSPNKNKLPNYNICIKKLLNICNKFIVCRYLSRTPQHSRPNSLRRQSRAKQSLTYISKNSHLNVERTLDQSLVIRYSQKQFRARSNKDLQKTIQALSSSPLKKQQRNFLLLRIYFLFKTSSCETYLFSVL